MDEDDENRTTTTALLLWRVGRRRARSVPQSCACCANATATLACAKRNPSPLLNPKVLKSNPKLRHNSQNASY